MHKPYQIFKKTADIILALLITIPALIIIGCCYIAIKVETKGPAFFVQERPGYKGKILRIYKLRTMIVETERNSKQLSDMERMTWVGRLIRKLSFDELPQIMNIIKGEMSFIGPRPLLIDYLSLYTPEQMRRHNVLPGISGWAQVNGRNEISWEQKFERDLWYVDNMSFSVDVKVFWMTLICVFKHKGINASEGLPMQDFRGTIYDNPK